MKKKVLIYRNHLLRPSETFIRSQAESLKSFDASYVGLCTVPSVSVPPGKIFTVCQQYPSQTQRILVYKLCGRHSPFFKEIAKTSPSLVHAHFGPDGVKAIPLATQLNIPLIVTFHGYDITIKPFYAWHSSYSYFMYLARRKRLRKVASKFIAVSNFVKEKLIQKGFSADKIVVHYIGVDVEKFSCVSSQIRDPIVLFVGRLVEVKGCEFLIKAMAKVQSILPNAELVILGDGPLKNTLEKMACKTLKNCRFLGFQPPSVVKDWMQRAKVFSVPSVSTKSGYTEAFGIAFLEAQSMGLPVVSSLSGGIPEAVKDTETGFLVPEKDSQALADRILTLLRDESLWYQMSQNAVARTRSHFDIKKQTKKLEAIYSEVLLARK
ncbi:MAG: glycosyltransferase [Phormidesmis sp.]